MPTGKALAFIADENGVEAQGTLTIDTKPIAGDTMTVDAKVYTFKDTITAADGDVFIGALLADSQANIVAAFNLTGVAGTDYGSGMTYHPTVSIAAFAADDAVLTAKTGGTAGNSIATTETFDEGTNVFDAATLGTTTTGAVPTSLELAAVVNALFAELRTRGWMDPAL